MDKMEVFDWVSLKGLKYKVTPPMAEAYMRHEAGVL